MRLEVRLVKVFVRSVEYNGWEGTRCEMGSNVTVVLHGGLDR